MDIHVTQESRTEQQPSQARSPRRGRARLDVDARARVSRGRRPVREHTDLDAMYLTEMASSTVLTPQQEVELGQRIAAAERALLEAVVLAPSGARTLTAIADELEAGTLDEQEGSGVLNVGMLLDTLTHGAHRPRHEVRV